MTATSPGQTPDGRIVPGIALTVVKNAGVVDEAGKEPFRPPAVLDGVSSLDGDRSLPLAGSYAGGYRSLSTSPGR